MESRRNSPADAGLGNRATPDDDDRRRSDTAAAAPLPVSAALPANTAQAGANYLVRHWRGELPLAISYWVNNFVGNVILFIVIALLAFFLTRLENNYGLALRWSLVWLLASMLAIWQVVGLWRSANRHIVTTQRVFWSRAAQVMAALALLRLDVSLQRDGIPTIQKSLARAHWLEQNGKWEFRVLKDGTELELSSGIGFGMTKARSA